MSYSIYEPQRLQILSTLWQAVEQNTDRETIGRITMFKKEDLIGKKIGDIITDDTKILTEFTNGFNVKDVVLKFAEVQTHGDYAVVYDEYYVICFKSEKPVALFHVYELRDCALNGERGLVTAMGHETTHEYWFDNGEYEGRHTR